MSSFSGVMPKMARSFRASPSLPSPSIISARSFATISRLQLRTQPISRITTTPSLFLSSKRAFGLSSLNPWAGPEKEDALSPLVPADIGDNLPPSSFASVPPTPPTPAPASLPTPPSSSSTPTPTPNVDSQISAADIESYSSSLPTPPSTNQSSAALRNFAPDSPNLPFMPPKQIKSIPGDDFFLDANPITDLAHIDIQIGDLKAMGLNGWFPTRTFQSIIEYIHVFTGLPWWATIIAATLLVRGIIAPLMVGNFRKSGNMMLVAPQTKIITDAISRAKEEGDRASMAALSAELRAHWKKNDCSPASALIFPLVSIPLFMTMFFSVRAMADLPVPQLTVGGIPGWCYDLTAVDPTYILPVLAAGMTFLTMHLGITGVPPKFQPGYQQAVSGGMKYMSLLGIPVFGGFTVASWMPFFGGSVVGGFPAALLLYWATSNSFQVAQSLLLRTHWARDRFRLPPTPTEASIGRPVISDWEAIKAGYKAFHNLTQKNATKAQKEAKAIQDANAKRRAAGGSNFNKAPIDPEVALQQKREARAAFEKLTKEREEVKRAQMIKSSKTLSEVVGGSGAGGVLGSHVVKGAAAKGGDAQGWTSTSTKKTSSAVKGAGGGGGVQTELEMLRARRVKAEEMLAAAKQAAKAGKGKK